MPSMYLSHVTPDGSVAKRAAPDVLDGSRGPGFQTPPGPCPKAPSSERVGSRCHARVDYSLR